MRYHLTPARMAAIKKPRNNIVYCFPIYLHEVMGPDAMILVF